MSIVFYGADQTFSRCNYVRDDYYGYLVMAECKGSRGWGMVNLNCESGEVKSTNGCISAPIVDKGPPCESQAGNPVDASSGMKLEYALDFTTAGPLPLKFERHYRSETNTRDGEYKTSRLSGAISSTSPELTISEPRTTRPTPIRVPAASARLQVPGERTATPMMRLAIA